MFAPGVSVCLGRGPESCVDARGLAAGQGRLGSLVSEWWSRGPRPTHFRGLAATVHALVRGKRFAGCDNCSIPQAHPSRRRCSRSEKSQEAFVEGLLAALGVRAGFFIEVGGHDGFSGSNTVFTEACKGWRGLLVEANPAAFAALRNARPHALALRAALCPQHGVVQFASSDRAADVTGGMTSVLGHFKGLGSQRKSRIGENGGVVAGKTYPVPCGPLRDYLALLRVKRVDVFWVDVEGAERAVLESVDFAAVSFGVVVVEMRFDDRAKNVALLRVMAAAGFELVRTLSVWPGRILDCVFLRAPHFAPVLPEAALRHLRTVGRNAATVRRDGALRPGRWSTTGYTVEPPAILTRCRVSVKWGFSDDNRGECLRIPPMHARHVADWVSAGQLYARASAASIWFVERAQHLMDEYVISDADAMQALLSGHAQVGDALRAPRAARPAAAAAAHGAPNASIWLKPMWLEAGEAEPYRGRGLSNQRFIRPINAPLTPQAWSLVQAERTRHGFTWEPLPEAAYLHTAAAFSEMRADMLGSGVGSARRRLATLKVTCHIKAELGRPDADGSFLFRPGAPDAQATGGAQHARDRPGPQGLRQHGRRGRRARSPAGRWAAASGGG